MMKAERLKTTSVTAKGASREGTMGSTGGCRYRTVTGGRMQASRRVPHCGNPTYQNAP